MKIVVRAVSVYLALMFLNATAFFAVNLQGDRLEGVATSGAEGVLLIVFLLMQMVIAPYASLQVWQLRRSGKYAAIGLLTAKLLLYGTGWLVFRNSGAALAVGATVALHASCILLLISRPVSALFTSTTDKDAHHAL